MTHGTRGFYNDSIVTHYDQKHDVFTYRSVTGLACFDSTGFFLHKLVTVCAERYENRTYNITCIFLHTSHVFFKLYLI